MRLIESGLSPVNTDGLFEKERGMSTAARIWVGLLVDQKFEVFGASTRASELAKQLAGVKLKLEEVGGLVADLNARERELREVGNNAKAEDMADILRRAAKNLPSQVVAPMSVNAGKDPASIDKFYL